MFFSLTTVHWYNMAQYRHQSSIQICSIASVSRQNPPITHFYPSTNALIVDNTLYFICVERRLALMFISLDRFNGTLTRCIRLRCTENNTLDDGIYMSSNPSLLSTSACNPWMGPCGWDQSTWSKQYHPVHIGRKYLCIWTCSLNGCGDQLLKFIAISHDGHSLGQKLS